MLDLYGKRVVRSRGAGVNRRASNARQASIIFIRKPIRHALRVRAWLEIAACVAGRERVDRRHQTKPPPSANQPMKRLSQLSEPEAKPLMLANLYRRLFWHSAS